MDAWRPPREFDDYVVVSALGAGRNGSVWLAEDTLLARHVAVKFTAAPQPDAAERQRFMIEARAAARVQHPNVVSIYRVGALGDRPYLVTEFVRGATLDRLEKPLPWREALRLGLDLARGLAAAHRRAVLHCDLKPANAILGEDGTAKLLDFGLAGFIRGEDGAEARAEGLRGTPAYLAPELWRGEPHSRRSDVYALGAVLHELCSGRPPSGEVPLPDLPRSVQDQDPPCLAAADGPEAGLAAVVARCLRRDPAERFATADDLREALEALTPAGADARLLTGNPYRGLRAFQADHRALFFGRTSEIGVVVERLRTDPLVLVTGDSGVGKSSLCRAGVLPAAAEGGLGDERAWSVATLVPGRDPVGALCAAVGDLAGADPEALRRELADDPQALARALRRRLARTRGVLLFVDQLEELLTVADPVQALAADAALGALAGGLPGVRVLSTLRADFLGRFTGLRVLGEDLGRALFFLRPLAADRLREVILGPARVTGARFETEAVVEALVSATAAAEGGLPLLQFALAELWERRDQKTQTLTQEALDRMGGVSGALARHADGVLAALPAAQRAAARRMLLRLVTLEGTRARRTDAELGSEDPAARAALDALVRGRLLVAQEGDDGSSYELAHEVLVHGWGTLARWLREEVERRILREALAGQAQDWARRGRSREALLGPGRLREVEALGAEDLTALERELLAASRRELVRRRLRVRAAAVAVPLLAVAIWAGAAASARSETSRKVAEHVAAGHAALAQARGGAEAAARARRDALDRFDRLEEGAEDAWAQALEARRAADGAYRAAAASLETALALDPGRRALRAELADALLERALLADEGRDRERRDELVQRFQVYDDDGSRLARWQAPARLELEVTPAGAAVTLLHAPGSGEEAAPAELGAAPVAPRALAPGSWIVDVRAQGFAPARLPFVATRGARVALEVHLPEASSVPPGFTLIPPGAFRFGSDGDEEVRKGFLYAQPLHEIRTGAYAIARHELTYREWIGWLESLPAAERRLRTPLVTAGPATPGALELRQAPGGWELLLQPGATRLVGRWGEPLAYPGRPGDAPIEWRDLPVTGISAADAEAYAAWLRTTGRVPGARLCSELEWERAARGADGRPFPAGPDLAVGSANIDTTHSEEGRGPDPVGSHPASRSIHGLDDTAGNVWELTRARAPGEYVVKGGSYWHDRTTAQLANRDRVTDTMREATVGMRLCASVEERATAP